jgi:formate dehydrogenase gamma subunit
MISFLITVFLFSGIAFSQSNEDCLACHDDADMTMTKGNKEISLYANPEVLMKSVHRKLNCVSCHTGFDPDDIPHKEEINPINCMSCHKDAPVKHPFHPQMKTSLGTNGKADVSCKTCHGTHDVASPRAASNQWHTQNQPESCGQCHKDASRDYRESQHFIAFRGGQAGAPNCNTCHRTDVTGTTIKDTLKLKLAQKQLCLSCHLDNPDVRSRTSVDAGFIQSYEASIHGIAFAKGNASAASCVDCHGSHLVKKHDDPASPIHKSNISSTCASCHGDIAKEYEESIHGVALLAGKQGTPTCTDCHGEHNILKSDDPLARTSYARVSLEVCSPCHSSLELAEEYGISSNRYKTFADSYHGLALRGGSLSVANCASCHGVHNIKPSSDPSSMIHKDNIPQTCGTCHPGAGTNFAIGKIHVTLERDDDALLYWIATIYIILIVVIIGGMFIHNIFDFVRKSIDKRNRVHHAPKKENHALYLRMTLNERIQHGLLAISFILLVITGFMLRFPEAWWVEYIRNLSESAFDYRSLMHRYAAVVMVGVSLYHIYYVSFTSRGRQLIKDLFPVYQDLKEAIGVAKYNMGISKVKPKLGRFSYIEKAEYWALIWGTIIMSITGFIMWFDNTFMNLLTKYGWDIARTIHYYEAWLAFLAIVVWHFYFVIFNPDVYPLNRAFWKGTLTEEEMEHEHPRELEEIKRKQAERENEDEADNDLNKK